MPLSTADWARFGRHAPRVKSWHLETLGILNGDGYSCIEAMRSSSPLNKVFPNLRHFGCADPRMTPYIDWLIRPSLDSVYGLYSCEDEEATIRFLDTIATSAPSLRAIELDAYGTDTPAMVAALSRALSCQSHLTTLKVCMALPKNVLERVAALPGLVHLTLSLENKDYETMFTSFKKPRFVALRCLDVYSSVQHVEPLSGFLRGIAPRELLDLDICLDLFYNESGGAWHRRPTLLFLRSLYTAVAALNPRRSLSVSAPNSCQTAMLHHVAMSSTFEPLLRLTTLKRLDARSLPFCLHPGDFETIARAFPAIEELNLGQETKANITSARPCDLIHFARHCPNLRILSLPFRCDFNEIPSLAGPRHSHSEPILRTLAMGESNVLDSELAEFAAFVFEIFPHADVAHWYDRLPSGYRTSWVERVEEVQQMILALKAAKLG